MDRAHAGSGHRPVLYAQVLDGLQVRADGIYLDGTFGAAATPAACWNGWDRKGGCC